VGGVRSKVCHDWAIICKGGENRNGRCGNAGYPLQKVTGEIRSAGFEVKKTYRVFEMPYHRFFVLTKGEKKD